MKSKYFHRDNLKIPFCGSGNKIVKKKEVNNATSKHIAASDIRGN